MSAAEEYDLVVLGSGAPGKLLAWTLASVAMAAGLPYAALRDTVLTHPTMAEGLGELFSSVPRG